MTAKLKLQDKLIEVATSGSHAITIDNVTYKLPNDTVTSQQLLKALNDVQKLTGNVECELLQIVGTWKRL
jgi:hypothetical protein